MIKFIVISSIFVVSGLACYSNKSVQTTSSSLSPTSTQNNLANEAEYKDNESEETEDKQINDNDEQTISIKSTIGLITLGDKDPDFNPKKDKNHFIRFYNEDGSLWYEFTFYYDDSDGKFEYQNDEFIVFAFHADYFLLKVRAVGEDEDRYQVIVNEETGLKKYVKKSDKNLKLETWKEHILNTFAIDLEQGKNKVFDSPNGKDIKLDVKQIERFEAVEMKDDWIKVKWEIPNKNDEYQAGWVRWKKNDIILIGSFHFA